MQTEFEPGASARQENALLSSDSRCCRMTVRRAIVGRTAEREAKPQALAAFMHAFAGLESDGAAGDLMPLVAGAPDSLQGWSAALRVRANELQLLWLSQAPAPMQSQDTVAVLLDKVLTESTAHPLINAVEMTDALCAFELRGPHAFAILQRLVDVLSVPVRNDTFTRCRWVDITATLVRLGEGHYLILADVHLANYVQDWVSHALAAISA